MRKNEFYIKLIHIPKPRKDLPISCHFVVFGIRTPTRRVTLEGQYQAQLFAVAYEPPILWEQGRDTANIKNGLKTQTTVATSPWTSDSRLRVSITCSLDIK